MELTISTDDGARPGWRVVGTSQARLWGMTPAERLQRTFRRLGLAPAADAGETAVLAAHCGWVFDESLLRLLAARPGVALVDEAGVAVAVHAVGPNRDAAVAALGQPAAAIGGGVTVLTADELGPAYNLELRKREAPILRRLTPANVVEVEKRLFKGSYKGVTDLVTKYVWPTPARIVTRWCAQVRMTPNQVTFIGFLLVLAAFALFWRGHFGWGLAAAWIMTFLDTVDGKLARVTLTSSKIGNVFDHGIDLVHPPFWWWAWLVGVEAGGHPLPRPDLYLAVILGGYVLQRVVEGVFLRRFKFHIHSWRRFDSFFRLITARRNPNLILLNLAALAGRPDIGLAAVAAWTAISLLVHVLQVAQAFAAPKGQVASWLER